MWVSVCLSVCVYVCLCRLYLQITGPDGKEIYSGARESNGKYTFSADQDGVYTYCFSNKMSTMTPKTVMFNMDIGDHKKEEGGKFFFL